MNVKTLLGQLKLLAILEGISYISFGITMPLKYMMGWKDPNYIVGVLHGGLFMMYCIWTATAFLQRKLSVKETALLLIASIVPFMTFWIERKLLKNKN
jgi:integral membrane protein